MGQKINPIGLRLGINRGWDSTWFAKKKDFGKYLIEDFKIRNYIKKIIQEMYSLNTHFKTWLRYREKRSRHRKNKKKYYENYRQ